MHAHTPTQTSTKHTHTHTHAGTEAGKHAHQHPSTQHNNTSAIQRINGASLKEHWAVQRNQVYKQQYLSAQPYTNIHTHAYKYTRIQHKMQLSVQRCAILTECIKRCAILALSHTQTYTHTHAYKYTHTTQNAAVCPKMCHLDRVR